MLPGAPFPAAAAVLDADARSVLAGAELMRGFDPGPELAPRAQLEKLALEDERDESVSLASRFASHAPRLAAAHPHGPAIVAEWMSGAVTGLLLAEDYGRLAHVLTGLQQASATDRSAEQPWAAAYAALNDRAQLRRLFERLRAASPSDAQGLQAIVGFISGDLLGLVLRALDQVESPQLRESLLNGMVAIAATAPAAFVTRLAPKKPHQRLSELCFALEKARAPERAAVFKNLLGRKDFRTHHRTMAGMARAGNDEGLKLLRHALADPSEEIRVSAIEVLGKCLPGRAFELLEGMLGESLQARSPAVRTAIWRAVASSDQPEAFYAIADVFKQRGSLLTRSRVQAQKLEALDGLATMRAPQALDLLKSLAADRSQPDAVVAAAGKLFAEAAEAAARHQAAGDPLAPDRVVSTPAAVLLELGGLAQAAGVIDPTSPCLARAYQRLAARLSALIRRERGFHLVVREDELYVNGVAVRDEPEERAVGALHARLRGRGVVACEVDALEPQELPELVRWLAEGELAGEVRTSGMKLLGLSGPARPAGPPVSLPQGDPTHEAVSRYARLVLAHRKASAAGGQGGPAFGDLGKTFDELVELYLTRRVRFLGLAPAVVGKEALPYDLANVALLSLAFGVELGLPRRRLRDLLELAFTHDVGMLAVPRDIWLRRGELQPHDREALRQARARSFWYPFEQLKTSCRVVPRMVAIVDCSLDWGVREASGAVAPRHDLGTSGTILALAKSYDALSSRRSFREALAPEAALKTLNGQLGHKFRPELLALFSKFVHGQPVSALPRQA